MENIAIERRRCMAVRIKNVLLTGGSGLVGRTLAPLLRATYRVTHFGVVPPGDGLPFIEGDVRDAQMKVQGTSADRPPWGPHRGAQSLGLRAVGAPAAGRILSAPCVSSGRSTCIRSIAHRALAAAGQICGGMAVTICECGLCWRSVLQGVLSNGGR